MLREVKKLAHFHAVSKKMRIQNQILASKTLPFMSSSSFSSSSELFLKRYGSYNLPFISIFSLNLEGALAYL